MGLYGENHNKAKLTEEDVAFIKANYGWRSEPGSGKMSGADLGKKFGVNPGVIMKIINGFSWKGKPQIRTTIESRSKAIRLSDCGPRKNRI